MWNISPIFVSYINGRNGSRLRKEVDKMQNRNEQHNESLPLTCYEVTFVKR